MSANHQHFKVMLGKDVTDQGFKEKRKCFLELDRFLYDKDGDFRARICALYGLRRSGKTVMMVQAILDMTPENREKSAYVVCTENGDSIELEDCLDNLIDQGVKFIFIDEITALYDFQGNSNIISDYYGSKAKIVIAGTDSLGIRLAMRDRLFDRVFTIHTTHVPYADYTRLLGGKTLDEYIEYGGTLTNDFYKEEQNCKEYKNVYIAENILHSLDSGYAGRRYWSSLTNIYDRKELVSIINKMVNQFSYNITLNAVQRDFKSAPLYATRNNLKSVPYNKMMDMKSVNDSVKKSLKIIDISDMGSGIREADLDDLKRYLKELDLFITIPSEKSFKRGPRQQDMEILLQPGMIYAHSTELIKELTNDDVWTEECNIVDRSAFIERADGFVKGEIMERIILSETFLDLGRKNDYRDDFYVAQLSLYTGENGYAGKTAEADMIVVDCKHKETYLFEIKHSNKVVASQTKHLLNDEFISYVNEHFAPVKRRTVIYNGETLRCSPVDYINAETYLKAVDDLKAQRMRNPKEPVEFGAMLEELVTGTRSLSDVGKIEACSIGKQREKVASMRSRKR